MTINDIIERYPTDIREHTERVADMARPLGEDYETVALLHDIIEDTNTTIEELINFLHLGYSMANDISILTFFCMCFHIFFIN